MHTGYKELDEAICLHIVTKPKMPPIYCEKLTAMASSELGRVCVHGDDKEWRLIDRRLQALKKAGRIRYERPIWILVTPK